MNLDDALQTFVTECRELLADMETALLTVEQAEDGHELVNAIFRAAHTIKGSAGLFSLDHIVAFTHVVENLLDQVRAGKIAITEPMVQTLLACRDHITALVDAVADGQMQADAALQEQGAPLLVQLRAHMGATEVAAPGALPSAQTPIGASNVPSRGEGVHSDHWHLSLRFGEGVLRNGMDPMSFLQYLATIGQIVSVVTVADALPAVDQMDPESCYLGFEVALNSAADRTTIENVFEFVRDDCQLTILPPHSQITRYIELIEHQTDPARLGEMLVTCGTLTAHELATALGKQSETPTKPIGVILVDHGIVAPRVVDAALAKQKRVRESQSPESSSVRVDAEKLDHLINLVGELIIAGAGVNLIAHRAQLAELQESTSKLTMLVQ